MNWHFDKPNTEVGDLGKEAKHGSDTLQDAKTNAH